MILPNIANKLSWESIAKSAIAIEESLSLDETLLESAFANLSIDSSPAIQPTSVTSNTTYENVDPMEINALNTSSHSHSSSRSGKFQHKKTREKSDPMRLWASDGQPICGICKKVGHLTKKCSQNPESTHFRQVHSMSAAKTIEYAAIPLEYDPIGIQHAAAIQSIDPVQQCNNVDLSSGSCSTPRVRLTIKGNLVQALVYTGASISAVRATIASGLGLQYDTSKAAAFTTADNKNVSSLGVTYVKAMLGNTRVSLACHVAPNLAHEVIFGYPNLKRHKILIDTNTDEIRLPKSISTLSPSAPGVCAMVSSLRLPRHSHAYVDISGPPMAFAFISTPNDTVMKKMLSVAAGVVKFNADGVATVKLANLDKDFKHVNKGQHIANFEYLSPTLRLYSQNDLSINNVSNQSNPQASVAMPDFSPFIGQHLSPSEHASMTILLQEFPDCFSSKPSSVTPRVQHSIDTGNTRPLSQPPVVFGYDLFENKQINRIK
ncbi:uncharacterized protein EV154DRAFT_574121 [Mucor mucedo]|uniref:uncharacterized protein n=1 Tax=Mucor mucedo TaxID=29922 RepID=UPI00221E8F23|nr:uncharacterized protein EV154DRAFT_574121 [Mucor mucedo]KAI7895283.1 hypothetical protein EV154DRAFT_574121 [Mucor mucedo]